MTSPCVFCDRISRDEVQARNGYAAAFPDGFPISPGHTLIVPIRHEGEFFSLERDEQMAMFDLIDEMQRRLLAELSPDAFNLGLNSGPAAGQTIGHAHLHLIPRFEGDMDDPRGGVRWIIPSKAKYWD